MRYNYNYTIAEKIIREIVQDITGFQSPGPANNLCDGAIAFRFNRNGKVHLVILYITPEMDEVTLKSYLKRIVPVEMEAAEALKASQPLGLNDQVFWGDRLN